MLKLVRMEGAAGNKYKNCSLGMKQRVGIAMALLGDPALLILDEPINGLDVDGMRIMREVLVDITKDLGCTVVISSYVLYFPSHRRHDPCPDPGHRQQHGAEKTSLV